MPDGKKKIFISWSKFQSRRVAHVLKDYLPEILEGVEIFMSDKDIDPGQRSMKVLERELDGTTYGIAVVTDANQAEPWLNFEAGALSKAVGNDSQGVPYVVPLLVDIPAITQLTGPISQFQAVQLNHDGLAEIITSICKLVNIDENIALKRFDRAWSEIDEALSKARKRPVPRNQKHVRTDSQKIDEVLQILRTLQRRVTVESQPMADFVELDDDELLGQVVGLAGKYGLRVVTEGRNLDGIKSFDILVPSGVTDSDIKKFEGDADERIIPRVDFLYTSE